jgi:endonuclease G
MKKMGKKNDIAVPNQFYKVVYAPEQDRAIAFLFRNEKAPNSWTNYAVTIDQVERLTGIDFLASLPDDSETVVEAKQNIKDWPRYYPRR